MLGDYDFGTEHEKIEPHSAASEEVGTLRRRCIRIGKKNINREVGFGFRVYEALFYLGGNFPLSLCSGSAGLALGVALGNFHMSI